MKAICKTERKPGVTVLDVPEPVRAADPVVKIEAASICGTDTHMYEWTGGYDFIPMPLVLGHEACGRVVYPGESGLEVGQRVVIDPVVSCGQCVFCRTGRDNLCLQRATLGLNRDGLFAEYAAVPARCCLPLDEDVPAAVGACLESLGVAVRAMENARPTVGDTAAIVGPGPIGLMCLLLCKRAGLAPVFVFGTRQDAARLALAKDLGADHVLRADDGSGMETFLRETGGLGVDCVFEWSGAGPGLATACSLAKAGGKVVDGAIYGKKPELDMTALVRREVALVTSRSRTYGTWARTLSLVANGLVDILPVVSRAFALDQAEEAFRLAAEKTILKAVLTL